MLTPKITVIVPIYGVEKYIERCAISLFEQTMDDIEYIFIDDCTKDNSITILQKVIECYPHRKNQITILHHTENKGLPIARKTGIEHAHGEYIAHCDSDDWVKKDIYQRMYEKATNENLDIVFCDFYKHYNGNNTIIRYFSNNYPKKPNVFTQLYGNESMHSIWGCICKKSIYDEVKIFPKKNIYEDYVFTIQLVYYANTIGYITEPLYYYCISDSSMSNKVEEKKVLGYVEDTRQNLKLAAEFAVEKKLNPNYVLLTELLYKVNLWSKIRDKKLLNGISYSNISTNRKYKILFNKIVSPALKFRYYVLKFRLFWFYDFVHKFIVANPNIRRNILSAKNR